MTRLPTTGLAALAVLLAALAILLGADGVRTQIHVERRTVVLAPRWIEGSPRSTSPHATIPSPAAPVRSSPGRTTPDQATRSEGTTEGATATGIEVVMPVTSRTTTTTTTLARSSGTPEPVVGATSTGARVQSGYFEGGFTSVTTPVTFQRSVSVSLDAQVVVSLTVACESGTVSGTGIGTVAIDLDAAATACQATFSVPAGSPDPLSWILTSS